MCSCLLATNGDKSSEAGVVIVYERRLTLKIGYIPSRFEKRTILQQSLEQNIAAAETL
jgi:hypothetical protein